jgi:hypothetical protein
MRAGVGNEASPCKNADPQSAVEIHSALFAAMAVHAAK